MASTNGQAETDLAKDNGDSESSGTNGSSGQDDGKDVSPAPSEPTQDKPRTQDKPQTQDKPRTQGKQEKNKTNLFVEVNSKETDVLVEKLDERDLNNLQTFLHLFRSMTGPSVLGTPSIIANGGILMGPVGFLLVGFLNTWCNNTMAKCSELLCTRRGVKSMNYEDIIEQSFLLHADNRPRQAKLASFMRQFVLGTLISCQVGVLSFMVKIVGTTTHKELSRAQPSQPLNVLLVELIVCICLIPYGWIRNLRLLSWVSLAGNLILLVCSCTIMQWAYRHHGPKHLPLVPPDPWTLLLMFSAALYTVEGIPMVIPIGNRTKQLDAFGGPCGLITLATTCNICLNAAVGFVGYVAIGPDVDGNFLVELPHEAIYTAVNVALVVMVFLSYTLQLYQPAEAISVMIKTRFDSGFAQSHGNKMARTLIVVASFVVCAAVPRVDLLMALVGASTTTLLVLGFPPLAELLIVYKDNGYFPWWILLKDTLLLVCGIVGFLTGTALCLKDIVMAL